MEKIENSGIREVVYIRIIKEPIKNPKEKHSLFSCGFSDYGFCTDNGCCTQQGCCTNQGCCTQRS